MSKYRKGSNVQWNWGNGTGTGQIKETFTRKVTRKLAGSEITKNGSDDCPAYLIEQDDGSQVLKLHSEIDRA